MTIEAPASTKTIPLAEIFGPTIQGEGALAGRPTFFLRVGGCDYKCLWCDTGFSVNPDEVRKLERKSVTEIIEQLDLWTVNHPGPTWLSISGGNPAMYDLSDIVSWWQVSGYGRDYEARKVTVETQGSRIQRWLKDVNQLTISPKPPSSGMSQERSLQNLTRFLEEVGDLYDEKHREVHRANGDPEDFKSSLKVIVFDETDYAFASVVHQRYPLMPFYLSCGTAMGGLTGKWVPPVIPGELAEFDPFRQVRANPDINWVPSSYAETKDHLLQRYRWLVEKAASDPIMADVAVFPQIHSLVWGIDTKGV